MTDIDPPRLAPPPPEPDYEAINARLVGLRRSMIGCFVPLAVDLGFKVFKQEQVPGAAPTIFLNPIDYASFNELVAAYSPSTEEAPPSIPAANPPHAGGGDGPIEVSALDHYDPGAKRTMIKPSTLADYKAQLNTAVGHLEHMAAWISSTNNGTARGTYSFEGLGEDMPAMKALL